MKEFHRNHAIRPTEPDKKDREKKLKNREGCKCLAPFVRLHYYDCPAVKKSCPVHGNQRYRAPRDVHPDPEKNMIISFHPSSKTERLFQPVKTLLAQCAPDTKVNLQYYSPKSTTSRESVQHGEGQTKPEDGKRALNNSIFVEKTKSFVADKTNKMKKLKQCFHSPCNSIAHKSRSQTSVREKFKEIFRDERKQTNMAPEKPPDDLQHEPNLSWFSNRLDFKDWEKLSRENTDSDFLTVTQQTKNNLINHKIFEIKHKKGLNDYPFFRLPERPSHLVYSSLDMNRPVEQKTRTYSERPERRFSLDESPPSEGKERQQRAESEKSSMENLHTSSSSSVYFTPFIFVPAGGDEPQMESQEHGDGKRESVAQETQTPSMRSEKEIVEEPNKTSVLMQTDADRQSGDTASPEWYLKNVEVADSFTTRGTQTDESLFRMDKCVGDSGRLSELSSEIFAPPSKNDACECKARYTQTSTNRPASHSGSKCPDSRAVSVQASRRRRPQGGPVSTTTWTMTTVDKLVQTESCNRMEIQRLWSFKVNKSQMASPKLSNKTTQTMFSGSESLEEISEFIDLDSSNVTFVVKPFDNRESDQAIDKLSKAWWGKSHSDSQLFISGKCSCYKPESVIRLTQGCSCHRSETTPASETHTKVEYKYTASCSSREKSWRDDKPRRKADKSLGPNDGSQRSYRRADKGMGTDSPVEFGLDSKADKALGTDSGVMKMSRKVDKALEVEDDLPGPSTPAATPRTVKSPRKVECSCQPEENSKDDCFPIPPLSDLSELTKTIQEFFQKMGKQPWRPCPCEGPMAERKPEKATPRRSRKESADPDEGRTDSPRKPKAEMVNAETQVTTPTKASPTKGVLLTGKSGSRPPTERIKIRRSVLLDDNEPRTRFICSVCAREISTYSTNVATNTENPQSTPRKRENSPAIRAEVSELVRMKSVRTIQNYDDPKRLTSAPEPRAQNSEPKEEAPQIIYKGSGSPKRQPPPQVTISEGAPRVKATPTMTISKPVRCICEQEIEVCTKDSCPNRDANQGTSRGGSPGTDRHASTSGGQSPNGRRRSSDKTRSHRRALEPYYPVFIKSPWPRDFTWSVAGGSQSSVPEEWESSTSTLQQNRSRSRESDGRKALEKPLGQYFMLGSATSQELRVGDHVFLPNKGGFILIPSLSASSIDHPKKHSPSQSEMPKTVGVTGATPLGLKDPPDLPSTTSCRLTPPGRLERDDKLFECRLCKSLTFVKTDRESVVFHWRHGLLTYRPQNPARARRDDSESLHPNESSAQNLDVLFEESSPSTGRSDSPSPYELLPEEEEEEEVEDTSEEEQKQEDANRRGRNATAPTLSDIFYPNAAVSSKSFNNFRSEGYIKDPKSDH